MSDKTATKEKKAKAASPSKRVYLFREGNSTMRDLLGGKGANLSEMVNIGLPVPPGFTVTTEVCNEYYRNNENLPKGLVDDMKAGIADMEKALGKKFGDKKNPLLVSVRSGAKFSMPGMMDTILNLGLNQETLKGLIEQSGDARFAYDANRRFIMMFSDVVLGVSKHKFEKIFDAKKREKGVKMDTDLEADDLKEIVVDFLALVLKETGDGFPSDPWKQLELAVEAVFNSWNNERAKYYRRQEKIPDEIGTAVNVQAMVFGNLGSDCGTGVAFTRDPSTGENALYGEYLMNAQGEDVVAGVRTPVPISELESQNPEVYQEFVEVCNRLEGHYKEMMDLEFTIERGRLFMLQCRVGKRTGPAAVHMAAQMVDEKLITEEEAIMRVSASHLDQLLHKRIDPEVFNKQEVRHLTTGLAASPGAAVGKVVFDADTAEELGEEGEKVILLRDETNPDDVHGMVASQGILTARGGKTSHAAVVARGFGIPCIAGADEVEIDEDTKKAVVDGLEINEGDMITIDGSSGKVYQGALPLVEPEIGGDFATLMKWCDKLRKLKVRTNADNPKDARKAIEFGAEGIGLCRTEHMFFEPDRLPIVQDMILTTSEHHRESALQKLQVVQQSDFEGIFEAMSGKPVTVRLIDPPLHEFLPNHEDMLREVAELRVAVNLTGGEALKGVLREKEKMLHAVEDMKESNPMMGLRGVRLSIIMPGIVEMQVRAILQAAAKVAKRGIKVLPEIMIPLVGHVNELRHIQEDLERVAKAVVEEQGVDIPYMFGTMIEIPRAALTAGEIAEYAQFFSFGTNDLTQMTFGYSRDDAESKFLNTYTNMKILPGNPFESLDQTGVGRLVDLAAKEGRKTRKNLKLGICGEHGGDPDSIDLCHRVGLDYVSCSPFRVPIARLSAAQAAIREKGSKHVQDK
jgi:pyruvate,orthophosphate dikinase